MIVAKLKHSILAGARGLGYEITKVQRHTPRPETGEISVPPVVSQVVEPPAKLGVDDLPIADKEMYLSLYGADVFDVRPFLNVGAGNFRHPAWRNLDFYTEGYAADVVSNMDIETDLSKQLDWPIASNSIEAVFTSHTIEHLQNQHDRHLFSEVYRILKPGGIFRITCPDIELYYNAYLRNDRYFYPSYGEWYLNESNEQLFLREFATQISTASNDDIPVAKATSKEIREKFQSMKMEDALDHFIARVDYNSWYKFAPGNHVNWWSYNKLFAFLREAGFVDMARSGFGQSRCPPMRAVPLFDWTAHKISLYVEAVK